MALGPGPAKVQLLGDVSISLDGRHIPLPPGKPTALLALLALHAERTVRTDAVAEALWGDQPPASARPLVHTYVSALRRALTAEPELGLSVRTVSGGYRLDAKRTQVDALAFLDLAARERTTSADLAAGLGRWSGPALSGVEAPFADPWRARLAAARNLVQERCWRERVGLDPGAVIPELRAAVLDRPLTEEPVLLLADALRRTGRPDEALRELDGYRHRLAHELGMDPSDRVVAARAEVVSAPALPVPAGRSGTGGQSGDEHRPAAAPALPAGRGRAATRLSSARAMGIGIAVLVVAVTALALGWRMSRSGAADTALSAPGLALVDPASGRLGPGLGLPVEPSGLAVGDGTAWVLSARQRSVLVVDLDRMGLVRTLGLPQAPTAVVAVDGIATVGLGFSGSLVSVTADRAGPPEPAGVGNGRLALAGDGRSVWAAAVDGSVARLAVPRSVRRIDGVPLRLAVDDRRVWVVTRDGRELVALDRRTGEATVSALRGEPVDVVASDDSAFAVTRADDRLWRASGTTALVDATTPLPGQPVGVAAAGGRVWVGIANPAMLVVFDVSSLDQVMTVELPRAPVGITAAGEQLVVAVR